MDRYKWVRKGSLNISWGNWPNFAQYCGLVNRFLSAYWDVPVAWIATSLETAFGLGLIS